MGSVHAIRDAQQLGPDSPSHRIRSQSYRRLLDLRIRKYSLYAIFGVKSMGSEHDQLWGGAFRIGKTMVGGSGWETRKDEAKKRPPVRHWGGWISTAIHEV